jgi:Tfp pilus assembly major pilin PilA
MVVGQHSTHTVDRNGGRHQANGKASNQTANNQHGNVHSSSLESSTQSGQESAYKHDWAAAKGVADVGDRDGPQNGSSCGMLDLELIQKAVTG